LIRNDSAYWTDEEGIVKVDRTRWEEAQKFESDGWMVHWRCDIDDRSPEHSMLFANYSILPDDLGHVAEYGCGPFTQLRHISTFHKKSFKSVCLIDPLIDSYPNLQNCTYKNGLLCGVSVTTVKSQAEEHIIHNNYDTIICINVLEHVQDVWKVLNNINASLKTGGRLILGERTYDNFDCTKLFDIGHPIRIKTAVIRKYQQNFRVLYNSTSQGYEGYFIGVKK